MIGCLGFIAVSCKKDNIRYQLNPVEVKNQEGTLEINDRDLYLEHGRARLIATYRNGDGLLQPDKIKVTPGNMFKRGYLEDTIENATKILEKILSRTDRYIA